ncbi:trigger factor [Naasia lichenicola]|nr:trigger factor [Naasia lichenicola]
MVTSTVEKLSPTRVKLEISVSQADFKPSIDHAYKHIAEQVSIPGFRKGKVPPPIIDQRVGKAAVIEHAVNEGMDRYYREALAANDLHPLGRPEADVTKLPDLKDYSGDLEMTIEVDVRPEIELPDYDNLTITVDAVEVTDAEVDEELERLRSRFGTLITVDRPAKTGDFAQIDLKATIGDSEVDTANGISYEIGSGDLIEGIDEALDSLSAGEQTTFDSVLLGGDHEGETALIVVDLLAVKERELPEADDDFAQIASEFDTLAELKEQLKDQVARSKSFGQAGEARNKLVEQLLESVDVPVPAQLVEDEVHRHLENENRLEDDVHRAEVTESSEKTFKQQILLDAIAEKEKVRVGQNELTNYVVQAASQYGMQPQEFAEVLQNNGQLPGVVAEVTRSKALALVLGKATVVDTNGAPVDLGDFVATPDEDDTFDVSAATAALQEANAHDHDGHDHAGHSH